MAILALIRHGKSVWNELGLWTGWTDVELHDTGKEDAKKMANYLRDVEIHSVHTSKLRRAKETAEIVLDSLNLTEIKIHEHQALNERHYGIYTGKNKWQVKELVGEEEFNNIRRGWDHAIPEGETLKNVHDRAIPYFKEQVTPQLKSGKNVLISAHGNTLRALTKHLQQLSESEISDIEIGIGEVHIYKYDGQNNLQDYVVRGENPNKGKV